jgi:prephenate dehydrogenase
MLFRQLTIVGVGLLGGSIGLAVRGAIPGCRIIGCGHRQQTLDRAVEMGAIDLPQADPAAAVIGSDLVILCTPVGLFESMLKQIAKSLPPNCIVTDVGSTKRSISAAAESMLPDFVDFVPSHPMSGSEKRGVEFARADLFRHGLCILTPTGKTRPSALARVEEFWRSLGMRTTCLDPATHDRLLADVSHLPHLLAAALVAMQEESGLDLCGQGFLDTTRIAGGDGALWRDILADNADNLRDGVQRLQEQLAKALSLLESPAGEALKDWLNAAAQRRQQLLQRKLREMNPD